MTAVTARESRAADSGIGRFTGPARRSLPVVVLLVAYGGFLGVLLPSLRPVAHTATAEVLLRPVVADPVTNQRADQLVSLDTEAVIVGSDEVLSKASEITGLSVGDLRSHLSVVAVPSSQVLRTSQTQERPREARLAADAVASTYLQQRQERARRLVANEVESITAQIGAVDTRLNELSQRVISSAPGSAERASVQSLQSSTAQQLAALQTRLLALQRTQIDSGEVLRNAGATKRSGFGRATTVPAGLLIGLLAGLALTVLLDRLSRTIRRPDDAARATGHRVLALLGDGRLDPTLAADQREEPDARAYRRALLAVEPGDDAVLAVVGSGPGTGAGPVSSGLATVAARGGSDVALLLLEPADLDDGPVEPTALAHVLGDAAAARPSSLAVGRGRLTVYVGDPSLEEVATPMAMAGGVAELRSLHDLVVVEIEDPMGSALAEAWIRACDHAVVAARLRRTRTGRLRTVAAHLDAAGHPPVGTIIVS